MVVLDKTLMPKQERLANLINNFVDVTKTNSEGRERSKNYFKTRIEVLDETWGSFLDNHEKLCKYSETALKDAVYFHDDWFGKVQELYLGAKTFLLDEIDKLNLIAQTAPTVPPAASVPTTQPVIRLDSHDLPRTQVPKFSGLAADWESFRQLFSSVVINKPSIPKVVKLQHLINAVEGPAARGLKSLEIIEQNFDVAWDKLLRRYDNPRIRLSKYLESVVSLKAVRKKNVSDLNEMLDVVSVARQGLRELFPNTPIESYDCWFVHCMIRKLDTEIRESWEVSEEEIGRNAPQNHFSSYESLTTFLEKRVQSFEQAHSSELGNISQVSTRKSTPENSRKSHSVNSNSTSTVDQKTNQRKVNVDKKCPVCQGPHFMSSCDQFLKLSPSQRLATAKSCKACLNCLGINHFVANCPSNKTCSTCGKKHHSKLHFDHKINDSADDPTSESPRERITTQKTSAHCTSIGATRLLATARIILESSKNNTVTVRALIDPASESSFISERIAKLLNVKRRAVSVDVFGVGSNSTNHSKGETTLLLKSPIDPDFQVSFSALILNQLTRLLPQKEIVNRTWPHIQGLTLADPYFYDPLKVDCILSAEIYSMIILDGVLRGSSDSPLAQLTVFGWILTGNTCSNSSTSRIGVNNFTSLASSAVSKEDMNYNSLNDGLTKFWEMEEIDSSMKISEDDQYCEDFFKRTTVRDSEGRFVVRLPFSNKLKDIDFCDSRDIAVSRFLSSEKRMAKNPNLKLAYSKFIDDYLSLNQMEAVPVSDKDKKSFYLPHHAVFRNDQSRKIRVVFNASQRTGAGYSLNDVLLTGPKLQKDIVKIINTWRFFKYVFTADIVKMFRQFRVHSEDVDWQRIVWRDDVSKKISDFRATTVTYGTAPAPFLALRCLEQLAEDGKENFPAASKILRGQIYVDDIYAGSNDFDEAIVMRNELIQLMRTAGIELDKWAANFRNLLTDVVSQDERSLDLNEIVSTLGLKWLPHDDTFFFKISLPDSGQATKRSVLSEISKLFDPLGWLAPFLIQAKIIMQDVWISKIGWDDPLEGEILRKWETFRSQIPDLSEIKIPRWYQGTSQQWHLHAFADASLRGYSAVIYYVNPNHNSTLMVSKSRVAPIKSQSLPRLELCAVVLLVSLMKYILTQLPTPPTEIFGWTDSKIVLCWLNKHPSHWPTFVANRVSKIITAFPNLKWRHVKSQDNPADCSTRGISVNQLADSSLWWNGPDWLTLDPLPDEYLKTNLDDTTLSTISHLTGLENSKTLKTTSSHILSTINNSSSFSKSVRIIAFCRRWLIPGKNKLPYFTARELHDAKVALFRVTQQEFYQTELDCIKRGSPLPRRSSLATLAPFICKEGLLRVGGRLQNAELSYNETHPVILPHQSLLVIRMVEEIHIITLHGGIQLMRSVINRSIWIPRGLNLFQKVFRTCVKCIRFSSQFLQQQMAPLPAVRLVPRFPFEYSGVDYAGPVSILFSKGRGAKSTKGYISIFICLVSRAVHIEVVSDLTTEAFLAAFSRFVSRRGICSFLHSDNGSNFKGAATELDKMFKESSRFSTEVAAAIAKDGTEWSFIPPRAPHFGGLWEAAVKSFKHHFKRVVGETTLTFEELCTVTSQIEAILNSRPLCPLSNDPNELVALTPGHILIGRSLAKFPEPFDFNSNLDLKFPRVSRWRLLKDMRDAFWKRWRKEVLQQLQQRNKWMSPSSNLQINDLVIVKDDQLPPLKWALGRVISVNKNKIDDLVRSVVLRTASSEITRPIVKLIKLPVDEQFEELVAKKKIDETC